jgi:murein DD-endopeptidase MepM/ murein hydrolase activator NlpD
MLAPHNSRMGAKLSSLFRGVLLLGICVAQFIGGSPVRAQLNPGPYEIVPFEDGFIIEAFYDLLTGTGNGIADWSGWSGSSWVSPNAYDGHQGTDIAVQTGTPLYGTAPGVVTEVVSIYPKNDHSTQYGNYVRVAVDGTSPNGEQLDILYLHMWTVMVTNGQRLNVGDQVGLSDSTGNSTSEHLHIQSEIRGSSSRCPFYWGHFKYPIMFNPAGNHQIGRVVKVTANSTVVRTDRFDNSSQITTVYKDQLYFSSYPKRGYFQIFIPNNGTYRSGWIRATDAAEVFTGTVIQALPDSVTYTHAGQLATKYTLRSQPDDDAPQVGQIFYGGGRFVADQVTNGFYRIPVPSATWAWVKPNNRMIVYPQLFNPANNPAAFPNLDFPIVESFSTIGKSMFGRPKFNRSYVKAFAPASPGGDGNALFITDATNAGNGLTESIIVGRPGHRNCFVQCDVYFNYAPAHVNVSQQRWERYGIFLRDDGFGGMTHTFEGGGNCYAITHDNDDGRLRAGRIVDATVTDLLPTARYETTSGWRRLRIEARDTTIKFFMNGTLLTVTDTNFPAGHAGLGYRWYPGSPASYPASRGIHFDNFIADTLEPVPLLFSNIRLQPNGALRCRIHSDVGTSNVIERTGSFSPTNWFSMGTVINSNSIVEFVDSDTNSATGFYRARRLP